MLVATLAVSLALAVGWFALELGSEEPQEQPLSPDAAGGLDQYRERSSTPVGVITDVEEAS
jgi:hypothetical protein